MKTQKTYFKEEQRFTQAWLWLVIVVALSGALLPVAAGLYVELIQGKPYGENPSSTQTLLIMFFLMASISTGIIILFWKMRLITEVRQDGIYLRFPPFLLKERKFHGDAITEYYIRQYKPIREYGGWGIRYGLGGYGRAYNVKGNTGMQLVFKNNKRMLIGTQRSEAFLRAVNRMMKKV